MADTDSPPCFARALLRRLLGRKRRVGVDRALAELYSRRVSAHGVRSARRWYRRQVAGFVLRWPLRHRGLIRGGARSLLDDLLQARRGLRHRPVFTGFVIVVMTLGVAAATIAFALIDAAAFRPLPFPGEDRLYGVSLRMPEAGYRILPRWFEYERWRKGLGSVDTVIAYQTRWRLLDGLDDSLDEVLTQAVSDNLFDALEVRMALGRPLLPPDYHAAAEPVAVLASEFWETTFGSDPAILGTTLRLHGRDHTVVGVVAAGYRFDFYRADVLVPLVDAELGASAFRERTQVLVGLRPGVDTQRVVAELAARVNPVEFRGVSEPASAELEPVRSLYYGWVLDWFGPYAGLIGFVLVLVCANVANLSLEWAVTRRRDTAVRCALGASRGRVARQVFLELTICGAVAGVLAVALGYQGTRLVVALDLLSSSRAPVIFDGRTAILALAAALMVSILAAVPPAWLAVRASPRSRPDGGASSGGTGARLGRALVVVQVACSLLLLAGAGLLLKTLVRMDEYDPGYDTRNLASVHFTARPGHEAPFPDVEPHAFADAMLARVRAVPGVLDAALGEYGGALGGDRGEGVTVEVPDGVEQRQPADERASSYYVSARYFETLGIGPVRGTGFAGLDTGAEAVAVINEAAAEAFWPHAGLDVLGRRFKLGAPDSDSSWLTVVGVVPNVGYTSLSGGLQWGRPPRVYVPHGLGAGRASSVLIRTAGPAPGFVPELREAAGDIDARLMLRLVDDLGAALDAELDAYTNRVRVLGMLAGFGLVLALMGVHGVVAYGVARRTREIGIRKALGALDRDVLATVIRESLQLTALGILLGLGLAAFVTDVLASQLYGMNPLDPSVLVLVASATFAVSGVAAWLPARNATRLDPMKALRAD